MTKAKTPEIKPIMVLKYIGIIICMLGMFSAYSNFIYAKSAIHEIYVVVDMIFWVLVAILIKIKGD